MYSYANIHTHTNTHPLITVVDMSDFFKQILDVGNKGAGSPGCSLTGVRAPVMSYPLAPYAPSMSIGRPSVC